MSAPALQWQWMAPRAVFSVIEESAISKLASDLPFLRRLSLSSGGRVRNISAFEKANAVLATEHVQKSREPLIVLVPFVPDALLYPCYALLARAVLDFVTAPMNERTSHLTPGAFVTIDTERKVLHARYLGISTRPPYHGWLEVKFANCVKQLPPDWATRLRVAHGNPRALSMSSEIPTLAVTRVAGIDPRSIASTTAVVMSREPAHASFSSAAIDGADPISEGIVGFTGMDGARLGKGLHSPITIVPSLAACRTLLRTVNVSSIVVDGMSRLAAGWDHIPFLRTSSGVVPIACFAPSNQYATRAAARLAGHSAVAWTRADITRTNRIDGRLPIPASLASALRASAEGPSVKTLKVACPQHEVELLASVKAARQAVRTLPESALMVGYQLKARLRKLDAILRAPGRGEMARSLAVPLIDGCLAQVASVAPHAKAFFEDVKASLSSAWDALSRMPDGTNARAEALIADLRPRGAEHCHVLCATGEQAALVADLGAQLDLPLDPITSVSASRRVHILAVTGWQGEEYALLAEASSPSTMLVLATEPEDSAWRRHFRFRSVLSGRLGGSAGAQIFEAPAQIAETIRAAAPRARRRFPQEQYVPCILVWLQGESLPIAVSPQSPVMFSVDGETKSASEIQAGDEIVLSNCFAPDALSSSFANLRREAIEQIDRENAELVAVTQDWRRVLQKHAQYNHLKPRDIRELLLKHGVKRATSTIEYWLNADTDELIHPQDANATLHAIWAIAGEKAQYSRERVLAAIQTRLEYHQQPGRALWDTWAGRTPTLPVRAPWLAEWAGKARLLATVGVVEWAQAGQVPLELMGERVSLDVFEIPEMDPALEGLQDSALVQEPEVVCDS